MATAPSAEALPIPDLWRLLEVGTEGAWMWRIEADRVMWSPKLLRWLGAADQPRGLHEVEALIHPDDLETFRSAVQRALEEGGEFRVRVRLQTGDGRYAPVHSHAALLSPDNASGRCLAGFILDESDAARTREELERSRARLQAFMDNCPAGVFIKAADGQHLYANRKAGEIAGFPPESMIGRRTDDLFPQDIAERLMRTDREVLDRGAPVYSTEVVTTATGQRRHVMDVKFPLPDLSSDSTVVAGFGLDITERVEQEERLRALDKRLQDKQRLESLGMLAGGIAHDFNNVLHAIMGNAELAGLVDGPERAEHLAAVQERCLYAARLCDQLLVYAGRHRARLMATDVVQLVREASKLLDVSKHRGIQVSFEVPGTLPKVRADAVQLRQVLLNLVINAAQAVETTPNGQVTVRVEVRPQVVPRPCAHSWLEDTGNLMCFVIDDNGVGMSEDELELAFEPFFSTKPQGHGLGLSTVLGIIRTHGGAVTVESAAGGGSRFEVYLPTVSVAPPVEPSRDATLLDGRTALVVDDQPEVLGVAVRLMERFGIEAVAAGSAEEALRKLDSHTGTVDIALLDVTMPGMSGVELADEIVRRRPETAVVLTSGYANEDRFDGAAAFLTKPFTRASLQTVLLQVLGARPKL